MSAARFVLGSVIVALLFAAMFFAGFALSAGGVSGWVALAREGSAAVGRGPVQAGWRRSRQWAEQPHSLPDLVDSYRAFATEVAEWWRAETDGRGKLLIAIDEVDRIAEPQQAEQFVNEIKAAFGVRHCVFLVSLSDEALANFERRLVRVRTVFDSAFDHVVRLRALTLAESVNLLRNRVTGVPDVFWMLCHCLAGGMPRDVLRMARTMLDQHRLTPGPTELSAMAQRLVAIEAQAVKRAFAMQTSAKIDPVLAERLVDAAWPGPLSDDLVWAAENQLATGENQLATGAGPASSIAAIYLYYATVLEIFTSAPHILRGWRGLLGPGRRARPPEPAARLVADLAEAHRLMAVDAAVAIKQIRRIRGDIQAMPS